jgi:hypothetical protein
MEIKKGTWLCYDRAADRLVLGKLDVGANDADAVVAECKRAVPGVNSLGWIHSGSMEALTMQPHEAPHIDAVVAWFKRNKRQMRFELWRY